MQNGQVQLTTLQDYKNERTIKYRAHQKYAYGERSNKHPHGKLLRLQVKLNNGLGLSSIEGKSAITDQERPYEIAIFDKTGLFTQEYTDDCDADDIVIGYCDVDKVMHYLNKISTIII